MQADVQTFRADTPRAALAAVKAALGPEAVILATRELKGGLLKQAAVEVLAAPPAPPAPAPQQQAAPAVQPLSSDEKTESITLPPANDAARAIQSRRARAAFVENTRRRSKRRKKQEATLLPTDTGALADAYAANPFAAPLHPAFEDPFEASFFAPPVMEGEEDTELDLRAQPLFEEAQSDPKLESFVGAAAHVVSGPSAQAREPAAAERDAVQSGWVNSLMRRGVSERLAGQLVDAALLGQPELSVEQARERLMRTVREHVQVVRAPWSPDATGHRDVVALVGPTGVGKTTTIAKIAARAIMEFSLKVALITVDTYRIGAAHQLARYGELLGAPTFVARDRAGLTQAMERSKSADLILIDTAGRSAAAEVAAQASLLRSIDDVQMHLVVSATSGETHLRRIKSHFAVADADRLIVTKLDEGEGAACFLDPVVRLGQPLSCVTFGQRVPEDIDALSPGGLCERVVGR